MVLRAVKRLILDAAPWSYGDQVSPSSTMIYGIILASESDVVLVETFESRFENPDGVVENAKTSRHVPKNHVVWHIIQGPLRLSGHARASTSVAQNSRRRLAPHACFLNLFAKEWMPKGLDSWFAQSSPGVQGLFTFGPFHQTLRRRRYGVEMRRATLLPGIGQFSLGARSMAP